MLTSRLARLRARTTGFPGLVLLLVVTFLVAGELVHEAWIAGRARQQATDRALSDFTRFAAWTMSYRTRANVDIAITTLLNAVGARSGAALTADPRGAPPSPVTLAETAERLRACRCTVVFAPSYYVRVGLTDGTVETASGAAPESELAWVRDTVAANERSRGRAGRDFALLFGGTSAHPRVVAYGVRRDTSRGLTDAYGFVADAPGFVATALGVSGSVPSPGFASVPAESALVAVVRDAAGRELFRSGGASAGNELTMVPTPDIHEGYVLARAPASTAVVFADSVHMDGELGGLTLRVALRRDAPQRLGVSAPERSRVPVLLAVLFVIAGLLALAVLELRREHELARARAEFTANVSHELRTPLAQILLFGETLIHERTRSERERRNAAEVIVREARRLMRLVDNALHFARSERRIVHVAVEPVEIAVLAREIMGSFAPIAWSAGATLCDALGADTLAFADRGAFRQVLLNLLDNAVKYGPRGQTVTVRAARRQGRVRVSVEDEGPGVPLAERRRIWTPFVRGLATSGSSGPGEFGAGIGLAVVHDLVARQAGRVWVEEGSSGGASFIVELQAVARDVSVLSEGRALL